VTAVVQQMRITINVLETDSLYSQLADEQIRFLLQKNLLTFARY